MGLFLYAKLNCLKNNWFWHWNFILMLSLIVWNRTVLTINCVQTKNYNFLKLFICIKMDLVLITHNGWCAIKPNQTKPNQTKPSYPGFEFGAPCPFSLYHKRLQTNGFGFRCFLSQTCCHKTIRESTLPFICTYLLFLKTFVRRIWYQIFLIQIICKQIYLAQSAGAAQYTDCIAAEE